MAQPPSSVLTLRPVFALRSVGERPCRGEPVGAHIALSGERVESSSKVVSEGDIRFVGVYLSPALQPRARARLAPFFIVRFLPVRSCSRRHTAISLGSTCVKSRISCVPNNRRRAVCLDADSATQLVFIYRGVGAKWVTGLRRPEVTFVVAMRSGQRAVQIYADG